MKSNEKLSDLITQLIEVWRDWMNNNAIVHDKLAPTTLRKHAAIECERLISLEYQIVNSIDRIFEICQIK